MQVETTSRGGNAQMDEGTLYKDYEQGKIWQNDFKDWGSLVPRALESDIHDNREREEQEREI